jgi:hypothetical protein
MNNLNRIKYFRFISLILMGSIFLPVIFTNLFPYFRTRHIYAVLWFMSLIIFNAKIFTSKLLLYFLAYGAIMYLLIRILWIDVDDWNIRAITIEFYDIVLAFTIFLYYYTEKDFTGLALLVRWTMVFILITAIMTIYTAIINPTYVRDLIGLDLNKRGAMEILSYKKLGGGNYGYASAVVCFFPISIYYYKNIFKSYWKKPYLILFTLIVFYALIKMQIFANILVATVSIIIALLGRKNVLKARVYVGVFIIILLLIPLKYYGDLFIYIGSFFESGSENYFKFIDMAKYLASGTHSIETGAGGRAQRFPLLLKSFLSNPLTGGEYWNGHMFWMNKLAVFGLLGSIPIFAIMYYGFRFTSKLFDKEFNFYYVLSVFSIVTLGFLKNLTGAELWVTTFVILPGLYYMPLIKKNKKQKVLYKEQLEIRLNN